MSTSIYCYRFGEFTVDVSRARLNRAGTEIALRPKSFALLEYFVTHAGRLNTKDELMSALWPNVVVTEDSLTRCISEVRSALGDGAQQTIKTVSKRGYVFVEPVTKVNDEELIERPERGPNPRAIGVALSRWRLAQWFILPVAILLSFGLWYLGTRQPSVAAPRLSLVVLPFANLNADPAQEYLADAISEDLTIALSRLRGSMVVAASSAFTLKGKPVDPKRLGAELGVRYALQGSVLRSHERVRINAKLIDTQSAATFWSDQVDVGRSELIQMQDEIVARLANALHAELVQAEGRRSILAARSNPDAEDLAMQCEAASFHSGGETSVPGYDLCEQALHIDPRNVRALVQLATYYANRVSRVQSPNPVADIARANELVARALDVDSDYYAAHCAKAVVLEDEHRLQESIIAAERCLVLNPSHAGAYRVLAADYFFLAQPERSLEFAERGIRLSPLDPQMSSFLLFKGWAYFMMERDEEALVWLRRAAAASPDSPTILAALTSELALTGHEAEARAALIHYLALKRTRTKTIAQWDHRPDDNAAFKKFDARFKSGLRLAGMPER